MIMVATFEEREPELQLAKHLDAHQVDGADDQHHAEHPDPVRHRREPDAHVDAEGGNVGDGDDQDFKAVGPAGDIARQSAEVFPGHSGRMSWRQGYAPTSSPSARIMIYAATPPIM